ncbi:hypothetical protein PF004_g24739 [Phytophthora fragariae]|nr:hypothetical protein PF004_g24739 [Phytophthora fragariae]
MMGRKLKTPAELLRRNRLAHPHGTLNAYHEVLLQDLMKARELAARALQKEQARQAMYYNQRKVRRRGAFAPNQLIWVYRLARGKKITKFGHRWRGQGQIMEPAGYDNYKIKMLDSGQELVTHCSFLLPYYYPQHLLEQMARDIAVDLREEAIAAADIDSEDEEAGKLKIASPPGDENSAAVAEHAGHGPGHEAAQDRPDSKSPPAQQVSSIPAASQAAPKKRSRGHAEQSAAQQQKKRSKHSEPAARSRTNEQVVHVPDNRGGAPPGEAEPERRPSPRHQGRAAARSRQGVSGDTIASRTRARSRRAPYPDSNDDGSRSSSPDRALAPDTALVEDADISPRDGRDQQRVEASRDDAEGSERRADYEGHAARDEGAGQHADVVPPGEQQDRVPHGGGERSVGTAEGTVADQRPSKRMKNQEFTCSPAAEGAAWTASCPRSQGSPDWSRPKPWCSADGGDIAHALGVMFGSSKLSAWVIDLTETASCGLINGTTSSSGVKGGYGRKTAATLAEKNKAPAMKASQRRIRRPRKVGQQRRQEVTRQQFQQQRKRTKYSSTAGRESGTIRPLEEESNRIEIVGARLA